MRLPAFVTDPLAQAAARQRAEIPAPERQRQVRAAVVILISVPFLLTLREYGFDPGNCWSCVRGLDRWFPGVLDALHTSENHRLTELAFWALGQVTCFFILPALVVKLVLRQKLLDYGLQTAGLGIHAWLYAGMLCFMLPFILLVATTREFQATYPFYQPQPGESLWPKFFLWQLFYAAQFVSLEFFFRGYLIHGLKPELGPYCILAMTIPYCVIHYGKPLPETLGSIGAGVVLGFMSLKTRSIWLGAALHIAVAVTMDAASLYHQGWFSIAGP